MARQKVVVIWLDGTFERDRYQPMIDEFNTQIDPTPPPSQDPIDKLICDETKQDLEKNGVIVLPAPTPAKAIELIKEHPGAKIIFISSGSLGKDMVPKIVDWASDYFQWLQMFNHQVDLLVRLMRDISGYFIEQGKMNLSLDDPATALQYFKHSLNLEIRANKRDKMEPNTKEAVQTHVQSDYRGQLNLLEGKNGLIRRTEKALYN